MNHLLYTFHPLADDQQTDIWIYTCQHWGVEQADHYIDGLHEKLASMAEGAAMASEELWR